MSCSISNRFESPRGVVMKVIRTFETSRLHERTSCQWRDSYASIRGDVPVHTVLARVPLEATHGFDEVLIQDDGCWERVHVSALLALVACQLSFAYPRVAAFR